MGVRNHIEAAIRHFGSETKLGEATGYTQHAIWRAKKRGSVTAEMALKIDQATKGDISASMLRPDLWPSERVAS